MTDIWQYFQNLFQRAEKSSKQEPLLHDNINRSPKEILAYEKWKNSLVKNQLIDMIKIAYQFFLVDGQTKDKNLYFLNNVSSKGFALYFVELRYTPQEINNLFDFLKEKILDLGYKSYSSDVRTYTKGDLVESFARYYLKPSLKNLLKKPPFNQEFGNISIELICQDDLPKTLKFTSTVYNDRSYQIAKPFEQLMKHILE